MENVINDAMDISRLENNKFEINKAMFDFRETVEEVYEVMKFQVDARDLDFKLRISDSVPSLIYSDQKRLKQVLYNLLGNAVKFTFEGEISLIITYDSHHVLTCTV